MSAPAPRVQIRIPLGGGVRFGPGKADLLEHIRATGSLSAAAGAMGMSYRRAWTLVAETNRAFRRPLVALSRGGEGGGGARLTPEGEAALAAFRALEARLGGEEALASLRALAAPGEGDISGQT